MRLEKIKLAGFKSFVDPTTVLLPSNLIGVIGPNGCGKSNVIDAVRWVMGESSAKHLRGDSMADVIFNGSTTRKPVGVATIELLFDNSDGRAAGQWAQYSHISVRRQVTRDGQSNYFLNGVRCRRRDVTDLFSGTGLGPRSYAIIEQGMISRFIEARPEELRRFIEEAAGISKYKDRRRETETRIRNTRENLERLNDVRVEVRSQLSRLERQAKTAEKYQRLKVQLRENEAQWMALQWRDLDQEEQHWQKNVQERETQIEELTANLRRVEAGIIHSREEHIEANDHLSTVQGSFYSLEADIAKREQSISHFKTLQKQQHSDLERIRQTIADEDQHLQEDQHQLDESQRELDLEEPELALAEQQEEETNELLAEVEETLAEWQDEWERFSQEQTKPSETAQVERSRMTHMEQRTEQNMQRTERLRDDLSQLITQDHSEQIEILVQTEEELLEKNEQIQTQLSENKEIERLRKDEHKQLNASLDVLMNDIRELQGQEVSLQTLQQASLGGDSQAGDWLKRHELDRFDRLAQSISVEPGWERAVEIVLGFYLEAVCIDDLTTVAPLFADFNHGEISFFSGDSSVDRSDSVDNVRLLDKVQSPWPLSPFLADIFIARDWVDAFSQRTSLANHESVITIDGLWLGQQWVRLHRQVDARHGVLARQQELKKIEKSLAELATSANVMQTDSEELIAILAQHELQSEEFQSQYYEFTHKLADVRSSLGAKRARQEQIVIRQQQLQTEIAELEQQQEQDEEAMQEARLRLHEALEQMETLADLKEDLNDKGVLLREQFEQTRQQRRQHRDRVHALALSVESKRSRQKSTQLNLERAEIRLAQLQTRRQELEDNLTTGVDPIAEVNQELQRLLEQQIVIKDQLGQARDGVTDIDNRLRKLESERANIDQTMGIKRSEVEQVRLSSHEILIKARNIKEQLGGEDSTIAALLANLPEDATPIVWKEQIDQLKTLIERLGAINLAAIDEFAEQSKRIEYLDAQHLDLTDALTTLENAIAKIDRESRNLFKQTFDQINSGLQAKFPLLFGGGQAYLELTGTDMLDTGVTIMARPPGKRNSTIHLLSGGEKTLVAVALVFSIFDLNPAPFCMLDEVDAPLDEANVGRFVELVREMSKQVQFIIITHNKTTMELAHQLTGVTMQEPGVSRLVTVDIEEAIEMTAGQ